MRKQDHSAALEKPCPYRTALEAIVGRTPPSWVRGNLSKLQDTEHEKLIEWIGASMQRNMEWVTLHGVIDAVCLLVQEAEANGNFKRSHPEYDLEYRTLLETAQEAEAVLSGAPIGWHRYTLATDVSSEREESGFTVKVTAGTEVFVQRVGFDTVHFRVTSDGETYKINAPVHLQGIDPPERRHTRQTL